MDDESSALRVEGYFDDRDVERLNPMPPALGACKGRLDELLELARKGKVDIVYIALPLRAESRISEIVRRLADSTASVYVVADFLVSISSTPSGRTYTACPWSACSRATFYGVNGWLKRVEDWSSAA